MSLLARREFVGHKFWRLRYYCMRGFLLPALVRLNHSLQNNQRIEPESHGSFLLICSPISFQCYKGEFIFMLRHLASVNTAQSLLEDVSRRLYLSQFRDIGDCSGRLSYEVDWLNVIRMVLDPYIVDNVDRWQEVGM